MQTSILIVGDNTSESDLLRYAFQQEGLRTTIANSAQQAVKLWETQSADLILILDHNSRYLDVIRKLREVAVVFCALIIDPISELAHRHALQNGVDLVIERPYPLSLLPIQVSTILQRIATSVPTGMTRIVQGDVRLEVDERTVQIGAAAPVRLSRLECHLLSTLMLHPNQVLSAETLVERIWGYSGEGSRELIRQLIWRVRRKIEVDPQTPRYLITLPQIGYRFETPQN